MWGRGNRRPKEEKASKRQRAPKRDMEFSDPSGWHFDPVEFTGSYQYMKEPELEQVQGPISEGTEKFQADPATYEGFFYQSNMVDWPEDQQSYTLVKRTGCGFQVQPEEGAAWTCMVAKYYTLSPDPTVEPDEYTDQMSYGGYALAASKMPGRGQGVADVPGCKIMDDIDPSDINQGAVGDCWLLSAISALAEYDGAVARLFKENDDLENSPHDEFNKYTITLCDLASWEKTNIVIDERLCSKADDSGILGARPSKTGELWVCYLEKAVACLCGGWDEINGGQPTHAWRIITGCKNTYYLQSSDDGWGCFGKFNPNSQEWEELGNSPHANTSIWPMEWPEVGGGGEMGSKKSPDEFFEQMCAWDDANYLMCAGTQAGSDENDQEGIVDGHAYTIMSVESNVAGTDFDLIQVRNPWGKGEFTSGMWDDGGPGWDENPEVKEALDPVFLDDGVFWVSKEEFFQFYPTVYLCAKDMAEFLQE